MSETLAYLAAVISAKTHLPIELVILRKYQTYNADYYLFLYFLSADSHLFLCFLSEDYHFFPVFPVCRLLLITVFPVCRLSLISCLQVIAAEGEQRASKALKEAADVISQSGTALQLRYLQTLNSIAAERNSTIIFPLPIDMLQGLGRNAGISE